MFRNKVVLITGASAGIGAVTAEKFAQEGATVVIVGRNDDRLKEVVDRCLKYGSEALAIKADLTKDNEADTIVEQTIEKFGKLDVLVNNAGIAREASIHSDQFLEVFDEVMNMNIRAVVRVTRHAASHLVDSKGNIVNVSSVAANFTKGTSYIALRTSKAALNHFTRCCAAELAQYGVRVNSVSPGPVLTSIFEGLTVGTDYYKANSALQKISEADEIANLILYMASGKARSVTGSDYVIDNGLLLL